jgi:predicted HTH transcriptional regulator
VPEGDSKQIAPAIEEQLTERQKKILKQAVVEGRITTGWLMSELGVAKITAVRDLKQLCQLKLLAKTGNGRGVHYIPFAGK